MSALAVDDLVLPVPVRPVAVRPVPVRPVPVCPVPERPAPQQWRHVERSPQARPHLVGLPGGRPAEATASPRPAAPGWQLTDRGIAVVVVFFLALVTTAAVVLVSAFLAVPETPVRPVEAPPALAVAA